ncbi:MAG: CinA family protein [Psychromonas sp.]|nr:CinA family protein [Psychromonas sp.]
MHSNNSIQKSAELLGKKLLKAGLIVSTAESCTGGGVAYAITEISGSSQWFDRGFVTYSNESKVEMLGVKNKTLETSGAVSQNIVIEMARGAVKNSKADIAVAISGIAGPNGGSDDKPVGTVCISWYSAHKKGKTATYIFVGGRNAIRCQAIQMALVGLIELAKN